MTESTAQSPRPSLDSALAAQLQQALARFDGIELAIVFGSAAMGQLRFESDLDIAVKLRHAMGVEEKIAMIEALAEQTGRPIDLIDLYDPPEPLLGQILKHGYRLIGSDTHYAQLVSRHLVEQADFMPLVNRMLKERREAWLAKVEQQKHYGE
jgi:predicted nucleotidyltransferase